MKPYKGTIRILRPLLMPHYSLTCTVLFIYLFGVLRRFQHCTGHITTGSWKGRGNQYIQFVRVLYCKLPTNSKQLPAFPLEAVPGCTVLRFRLCHASQIFHLLLPSPERERVRILQPDLLGFLGCAYPFLLSSKVVQQIALSKYV